MLQREGVMALLKAYHDISWIGGVPWSQGHPDDI